MPRPVLSTPAELPNELLGKRVLLRPYAEADAEPVFAAMEESRNHLRPWVTWLDHNRSVADVRGYCARCAANWRQRSDMTLGIFERETGRFLGGTGLHDPDWDLRAFEIGYWLRASAVGRGYTTEAVRLLAAFALDALRANRVEISCDAANVASQRVAERAGFTLDGRLRNGLLAPNGQPVDRLVFSRIPGDR